MKHREAGSRERIRPTYHNPTVPLSFHTDRTVMYDQQYRNAREYVIPFVSRHMPLEGRSILDIGCGDGGVLKAFAEQGCSGLGVDLSPARVEFATTMTEADGLADRLEFVSADIHDESASASWAGRFDLIILKDVIEHVPGKDLLMERIRTFLKQGGMVFFGFPPWRMPFGGHQQIAKSGVGKAPYIHMAPKSLYLRFLGAVGESEDTRRELGEIHDTRISIAGFERLARRNDFVVVEKAHFLVNPIYEFKFGMKPRRQFPLIRSLPFVRDFVTTACYYLLRPLPDK